MLNKFSGVKSASESVKKTRFDYLRITYEGSVPEYAYGPNWLLNQIKNGVHMFIWVEFFFLCFLYLVSVTAGAQEIPEGLWSQVLRATSVNS